MFELLIRLTWALALRWRWFCSRPFCTRGPVERRSGYAGVPLCGGRAQVGQAAELQRVEDADARHGDDERARLHRARHAARLLMEPHARHRRAADAVQGAPRPPSAVQWVRGVCVRVGGATHLPCRCSPRCAACLLYTSDAADDM
eukprot:6036935-Prymnesium_polylepis.1